MNFNTCIDVCNHHHSQDIEQFCYHKNVLVVVTSFPHPQSLATTDLFCVTIVLPFQEYHTVNLTICNLLRLASFIQQ